MATNPLKQLARLRRFNGEQDIKSFLNTEFRQSLKAIEDAFNTIGKQPYVLYCTKSLNFPTVNTTEATITLWDIPSQETTDAGSFDKVTGLWTCKKDGTFTFIGRAGVAVNGTNDVTIKWYLNDVVQTTATGLTSAYRAPTAVFSKRLVRGDIVKLTIVGSASQAMDGSTTYPIFFNVVQSGCI